MTLNEEFLKEDPREVNLPRWVRRQLGMARGEARRQAQLAKAARLDTDPAKSDAIIGMHADDIPVGVAKEYVVVRFLFELGNYHHKYIDVYFDRDRNLKLMSSNKLRISPQASNVVTIEEPRY